MGSVNQMEYHKRGNRIACRVCGKYISNSEPRLETSVLGFRSIIYIAIHLHHLNREERDKIMVEEL